MLRLWAWAFAGGILLGLAATRVAVCGTGALAVAAGLWLLRHRRPVLGTSALWLAAGLLAGAWAARPVPLPAAVRDLVARAEPVVVEAEWGRTLRAGGDPAQSARALLELRRLDGVAFGARAALTVQGRALDFAPGDLVRFRARPFEPAGLANPGRPAPELGFRLQGIALGLHLPRASALELVEAGAWWLPRRLAWRAHQSMARAINRAVAPPARAALLRALVLGERTAAGPQVEEGFKAAGAVHALSVSGLHLTAVAALAFLLLRRGLLLVPGLALRVRLPALAAAGALPLVIFYTLLTGESVATVRAAAMASLALVAILLRRHPDLGNAIAAAALALLGGAPLLVLDVSFQLSFVSVIALAVLAGAWAPAGPSASRLARAGRWLGRGLLASLAAFLVTAPLCAHHFAQLAPASPLGNLLLVPLIELFIVPLGLGGASLAALLPPLGQPLLWLASQLVGWTLWLAELFRQHAPVLTPWSPDGREAIALTGAALLGLTALTRTAVRRFLTWAALAGVLLGSASLLLRHAARRWQAGVQITFLDVGQGDAILIEGPRGFVALVDGGGAVAKGVGTPFNPGARVIVPVLRRKTIGHIDLVVLSHPHPDHLNGLFAVLEGFPVKALWTAGDGGGNPAYVRLLQLAHRRGVARPRPAPLHVQGLVLAPRGPWLGEAIQAPPGVSVNDASLVIAVEFAGRRVLLAGDLEEQGELELVARAAATGSSLASDVLKVPHHGSRTSSSAELLDAVAPGLAVISLGRGNRFGFPHPEIERRYRERTVPLYRTDLSGAVTVSIAADGALRVASVRGDP